MLLCTYLWELGIIYFFLWMIWYLCEHTPPQLKDLVFFLAEIPDITLYSFLLPVDILLSGSTTIWFIFTPPYPPLGFISSAICRGVDSVPFFRSFMKVWIVLAPLLTPGVWHWPPAGLCPAYHNPLCLAYQPVFNPPHCTYITHTSSACLWRHYRSKKPP